MNRIRELERELNTYRVKLETYRDCPKHRQHYETLYCDALAELSKEPQHIWKEYANWYARYERW